MLAVVTSQKYPCTPVCVGHIAEGLGSPASRNGSCVLCGVGKKAGWICAVGVIFECFHSDAKDLAGLRGNGTGSAKSVHVYSQASSGTRCSGLLPIGEIRFPHSPLCCRVPTIPYSRSVLVGWCFSCCRKFMYSLILNLTNLNLNLDSNDMRLLEKKQVGWLRGGSPHLQKIKLQSNSSNRLAFAVCDSPSPPAFFFFAWKYIHLQLWYLKNERIVRA